VRAHIDNSDNPQVLAIEALPSVGERNRREIMLARLLLLEEALEFLFAEY
jgi:hypothetical protein